MRASDATLLGALLAPCAALLSGCLPSMGGITRDQGYYEEWVFGAAGVYDVVHGVASFATLCEHEVQMDCPGGLVADPVLIVIEVDWQPDHYRMDRALPIISSEASAPDMGVPGYLKLGLFPGLEFNPDANVTCGGLAAEPGWRKLVPQMLRDSTLEDNDIDHEGLHRAIEEGASDTSRPITQAGGFTQLDCGGPPE